MKRIIVLGLALSSLAGTVECNNEFNQLQPTLTCSGFSVFVQPGACTLFENPCAPNRWIDPGGSRTDAFWISEGSRPDSVYVRQETASGITTRSFCAVEDSPLIANASLVFEYQRTSPTGQPAYGAGFLTLTVAPFLVVRASASPDRIDAADVSQLHAAVSGGIPPYSYSWIPTSPLSAARIPAPLASPNVTTTYTVRITDAAGQSASAHVTIRVNHQLFVTANPSVMPVGEGSQLNLSAAGGLLPYTYSWTPAATLDFPMLSNPLAQPLLTTTYTVTLTDADGVTLSGSVELTVRLDAEAPAPGPIDVGQGAQLDVTPIGGDGAYTYAWSPAAGLSDPTIRNPIASPSTSTVYTVVVTDGHGLTVSRQVPVTVNLPDLSAAFTFIRSQVGSSVSVNLDAGASTGNIVSYTWQFTLAIPVPDIVTASPQTTVMLAEGAGRGSVTLTVTAADGRTAAITKSYP